jgi:effector-binding domain-containing protein
MKKINLIIQQKEINELVGKEFEFSLYEEATIIDAIIEVDKKISAKGKFPIKDYHSLLHMIYNPIENRIYDHIIIIAFSEPQPYIDVKYKPKSKLPDGTTIKMILKAICGDAAPEKVVDYETFSRAMLKGSYRIS